MNMQLLPWNLEKKGEKLGSRELSELGEQSWVGRDTYFLIRSVKETSLQTGPATGARHARTHPHAHARTHSYVCHGR